MFEVTPAALARLEAFMADQHADAIRIHVTPSLHAAPALALALDSARENDAVYTAGALTFLVDRNLMADIQPVRIDADTVGLRFSSRLATEDGGCGCGCGGH